MDQELVHIRPNTIRRSTTRNSRRTLPLVGWAKIAMELAISKFDGEYLFSRYVKSGKCNADDASGALSKWLKIKLS